MLPVTTIVRLFGKDLSLIRQEVFRWELSFILRFVLGCDIHQSSNGIKIMSDPISPTPPTPDWEAIRLRKEAEERERVRRETFVALVRVGQLEKFPADDRLITFLKEFLHGNCDLYKRYFVANCLNNVFEGKDLDDELVRQQVRQAVKDDANAPTSRLYKALNYHRNLGFFTLFGAMGFFRWNYTRTLQEVHAILGAE